MPPQVIERIESLRRQRIPGKEIAATVGVPAAIVSRVLKRLGPRPLISDGSVWSSFTTTLNGREGYVFDLGIKLNLDVFNILNTQASQIDYFYASRLPGEPAAGVADRHFHPVEPTAVRLTLAKAF